MNLRWLFLILPSLVSADLVVSGGYVVVSGGKIRETTITEVQNATLMLHDGTKLVTGALHIGSNGVLQGCGTVTTGTIENDGLILADCGSGSTLVFYGSMENRESGVIRAENSTGITFASFTLNDGILDLIFSPSASPEISGGTGEIITSSTLPLISFNAPVDQLIFRIFGGHSYLVQYTDDLSADPVEWINVGTPHTTSLDQETKTIVLPAPASGARVFRYSVE